MKDKEQHRFSMVPVIREIGGHYIDVTTFSHQNFYNPSSHICFLKPGSFAGRRVQYLECDGLLLGEFLNNSENVLFSSSIPKGSVCVGIEVSNASIGRPMLNIYYEHESFSVVKWIPEKFPHGIITAKAKS